MQSTARIPVLLIYDVDPAWTSEERELADRETRRLSHAMRRRGHSVRMLPVTDPDFTGALATYDPGRFVVFNWCDGVPGVARSEAMVAEALENLRFTYTGATPEALELSCDKARVKRILESHDLPTPRWQLFTSANDRGWDCFPAIVKPAREHCSYGVDAGAVVSSPAELRSRVGYVLKTFRQPALVEDFIDGREFHVPLWGNEEVEMLPPVEMDFSCCDNIGERLCSYDAKFDPSSDAYKKIKSYVPARISPAEMAELESVCKGAYRVLGCRDYGRIDIRLRDGIFYVLDVNPNADVTVDASIAVAAAKAGYCYGAMGSRVLEFATQRRDQNLAPHQ